jgi:hypothetical protein
MAAMTVSRQIAAPTLTLTGSTASQNFQLDQRHVQVIGQRSSHHSRRSETSPSRHQTGCAWECNGVSGAQPILNGASCRSFARYCDASLSRTMGPLPDSDKLQRVVGYSLWTTTLPASLTTSGTGEPCRARSHCARLAHGARGLLQQNLTFEKNQRPDEVLGVCPENTRHVVAEVRSRLRLPGAHGFPS